jgi:hypothetical protein
MAQMSQVRCVSTIENDYSLMKFKTTTTFMPVHSKVYYIDTVQGITVKLYHHGEKFVCNGATIEIKLLMLQVF